MTIVNKDERITRSVPRSEREQLQRVSAKDTNEQQQETVPQLNKLPDDLAARILSFLDPPSLLRQRCLNRSFRRIASNTVLWKDLCHILWKDKVHVSREARMLLATDGMAAYRIALEDANTRDFITLEEFCYDPEAQQGTIWSLRFKESAGTDWTSWDPWWNYQLSRKMVFLRNGQVKMYVPRRGDTNNRQISTHNRPGDDTDTNEEVVGLEGMEQADFRVEGHHVIQHNQEGDLNEPSSPMSWRFITEPLDLPQRPVGSYVRIKVGGRDVPTYCCRRSPTGNWGFVMESCWGVCASFELPPRPRNLQHHRRRRLRRAHNLAGREIYLQVEVDDSSDEEATVSTNERATTITGRRRDGSDWGGVADEDLLVSEASFNITISLQWREAFLYNVGEDTLPEGPYALAEFQRTYENTMAEG